MSSYLGWPRSKCRWAGAGPGTCRSSGRAGPQQSPARQRSRSGTWPTLAQRGDPARPRWWPCGSRRPESPGEWWYGPRAVRTPDSAPCRGRCQTPGSRWWQPRLQPAPIRENSVLNIETRQQNSNAPRRWKKRKEWKYRQLKLFISKYMINWFSEKKIFSQ